MTVTITPELIKCACPTTNSPVQWSEAFTSCIPANWTADNVAMFLAQTGHESMDFRAVRENLNYSEAALLRVFPKYFQTRDLARDYARQPSRIANRVYANRMGNGNEASGDGWLYRGGGLLQLTGKNNYAAWGKTIGKSAEMAAAYILTKQGQISSALWFWGQHPALLNSDITTATKIINGGLNGFDDRRNRLLRIKHFMGI